MTRGTMRALSISSVATVVSGTFLVASPAQASTSCSTNPPEDVIKVVGDVNADGSGDTAVGVPKDHNLDGNLTGSVNLFLSDGTRQRITPGSLNFDASEAYGFGASVVLNDFDHDTCADLAIGAPDVGRVFIARGSRTGVLSTGVRIINTPAGADKKGLYTDAFGQSVVAAIRKPDGISDLWIGAPGATVDGKAKAGVVYHYEVSAGGVPKLLSKITDADAFGSAAADDRFGAVLAATANGVAVGVPHRAVGAKTGAGQVAVLRQPGGVLAKTVFTKASAGVAGTAAAGDHFGAAVAAGPMGTDLVVGAPDDDIGSAKDAGSVQAFFLDGEVFKPKKAFTQNTAGIPGKAEAGDRFGAAVASGRGILCQEYEGIAAGSPGEDLSSAKNAGTVTLIDEGAGADCKAKSRYQGQGLGGHPETGDNVGAHLSILRYRDDFDEDIYDRLLIGVPGENSTSGYLAGLTKPKGLRDITGDVPKSRFSTVIATDAAGQSF